MGVLTAWQCVHFLSPILLPSQQFRHTCEHINYTLLINIHGILCEGFQKYTYSVMGCGTSVPTQAEVPEEEGGVGKEGP